MRVSNINLTNTPRGYNIKVKNERERYVVVKIGQAYQVNIMKQYNVTGMHCAACSARVEKPCVYKRKRNWKIFPICEKLSA